MVFLRAGGNDLAEGNTPEQVFADFKEFVAVIQAKLPETEVIFISQSPSAARWQQAGKEKALNAMAQEFVRGKPHLGYIETYDVPLDADGKPRLELFLPDKLHFNAEGYKLLTERVRPWIPK